MEPIEKITSSIALAYTFIKIVNDDDISKETKVDLICHFMADKYMEIDHDLFYFVPVYVLMWTRGTMSTAEFTEKVKEMTSSWKNIIERSVKLTNLTFETFLGKGLHIDLTKDDLDED